MNKGQNPKQDEFERPSSFHDWLNDKKYKYFKIDSISVIDAIF